METLITTLSQDQDIINMIYVIWGLAGLYAVVAQLDIKATKLMKDMNI